MRALAALLALVACTKAEHEPPAPTEPAPAEPDLSRFPTTCAADAECSAVATSCCGCGPSAPLAAMRADAVASYRTQLNCTRDVGGAAMIDMTPACMRTAACVNGRCTLVHRAAVAPAPVDAAVADASLVDATEDDVTDAELLANPPRTCTKASDCELVAAGCCSCTKMGKQRSIRRDVSARYHRALRASCGSPMCPAAISDDPSCYGTPTCVRGTCSFKPGKNPELEPPTAPPPGGE